MQTPLFEMLDRISANLQKSQALISSSQKLLESDQPAAEAINMLSTGLDGMRYVTTALNELKDVSSRMDNAVFDASVNIGYAHSLLEMLSEAMPERQHMAMEALSSFTGTASKVLEDAWGIRREAGQPMENTE